jgi:hypothetical protein
MTKISQGRGTVSGATTWSRLRLHTPTWREDQPHQLNEAVPHGRLGRDLAALGCAALLAALGLKLWLAPSRAGTELAAPAAASAPLAAAPVQR